MGRGGAGMVQYRKGRSWDGAVWEGEELGWCSMGRGGAGVVQYGKEHSEFEH